ncbi:MAG: hypothetical protein MUF15_16000 [Acidobacteria bacterium]|nr:hypothetical protein [Acidobacteriota bacterium]
MISTHNKMERQDYVYVASLITVNNSSCPGCPNGEVIKKYTSSTLMRHGLYTYSIYSPQGGWVIISPNIGAIKEIIYTTSDAGNILAAATMEQQWIVQEDKATEAAAALAGMITPHIPAYDSMPAIRKAEIAREIEQLCSIFIQREKKYAYFQTETIPFDVRTFDYAEDHYDAGGLNPRSGRQDEENKHIQEKLLELLSYYWESVFITWWKGFW